MQTSLTIERVRTEDLLAKTRQAILDLCAAAYQEPMAPYLAAIGPGDHLLGLEAGCLMSHLMWVERWLQAERMLPLRTAYVELVATAPSAQGRGYATQLLEALPAYIQDFDLAALSPVTEELYLRLGWRYWRGPLAVRQHGTQLPTPDERIMILRLPRTPVLDDTSPLSVEWRPGEAW